MKKLLISFSGGRTSAFMCWWLLNKWEQRNEYEIVIVFANTGKESEETLFFVDECAQEWGIDIVWVEAQHNKGGKGWGVTHKVVNYETAARKGEPFEQMLSRLGIPSTNAPFCSDQLKRKAIESYLKSIGWQKKTYLVAIGIRSDEPKRYLTKTGKRKVKKNRLLPLVDLFPVDEPWVLHWWKGMSFNLTVNKDDGNCDNCWKKDLPRLCRNAIRKPNGFEWWQNMTNKYGYLNPRNTELKPPFNFYRGNLSPNDIIELANKQSQEQIKQMSLFEEKHTCGDTCEPF